MNSLTTALTTIRRSPYQALIAVLMTSLTFFISFLLSFVVIGAEIVLKHVESQPQIIAFFELGTEQVFIDNMKDKYNKNPQISSVQIVTQEQALDIYRKENSDDPLLIELVTADILPASIEVKTHNLEDLELIKTELDAEDSIEEVIYQQDVIVTLKKWTSGIRTGGIVVASVLAIVSFLSIMIVIALKATNQKNTISIFRLLGATQGFVKLPFIFEGVLYGFMGCLIGWILAFLTIVFSLPQIQAYIGNLFPLSIPLELLAIQLGLGILTSAILGATAGFVAVSRLMRT